MLWLGWWSSSQAPPTAQDLRRGRRRGIALLAVLGMLLVWALLQTPALRLIEHRIFDYFSTAAPPQTDAASPIIVAIDEPSMAEIGRQWPWPRDLHARLIAALREAGAVAIGIDIIFAEPSQPEADAALAAALGPDVVLAGDETLVETPHADQVVRVEPLPEFAAAGARTGIASIPLDADATFRRLPLYDDGFAAELLRARGVEVAPPRPGRFIQSFGPARSYPTVSYYQALDPETFLPEGFFRGRMAIVGLSTQSAPTVDAGGADQHATPFTVRTGRLVPGAEIQATLTDNLARNLFILRAPDLSVGAGVVVGALLAVMMVWRRTSWRTVAAGTLACAAMVIASWLLLQFGRVFLPPVGPVLAFVMVAAAQGARDYAAERRLRAGITRAFSQYLSPVLVERLAEQPGQLKLGGERRELTVLFCDVRGFTTIAESLKSDPQRLTSLMNRLITPLSQAVLAEGGTIDKYIGDCVMAFWNAPLDEPDHAWHGVRAALKMLDALDILNAELAEEAALDGGTALSLRVGIGINTGDCVVGNIGSDMRFAYSAMGDPVNLASRLEGESKSARVPIMLGELTASRVAGRLPVLRLGTIRVKGKDEPVRPSTVLRGAAPDADALAGHDALVDALNSGDEREARRLARMLRDMIPEIRGYYDGVLEGQAEAEPDYVD